MPVSFRFIDNKNPERKVMLAEIDELCCAFTGCPVQEKTNCRMYQIVTDIGIGLCWSELKATVEAFNKMEANWRVSMGADMNERAEQDIAFVRKMLVEDYTFEAWR